MNKDQVAGRVDQAKGKVKEVAGRVVGNESLEAEGTAEKVGGKVQSTYGDVKEKTKDAIKDGADKL
ncbi:CsbD family protein [Variovorax sp. LT1R16]|uniref:CsbD family protein n=1 Tax=Variovorax sp. LT1R16 TaxID=3443728 RepID=UPI003F46C33B